VFGNAFLRRSCVFERERWPTPDDDFLDLDWQVQPHAGRQPPLLVLFHGLEGSSQSHYAQAFATEAAAHGWDYVVVHFRGCSGALNKAPRAYHSGDSEEIDWLLRNLAASSGGRSCVMAVGVSLGGNALMRWAGERGASVRSQLPSLRAVAAVSSPLDLAAAGRAIDRGVNRVLYARHFLATMKRKAQAKHAQFPGLFNLHRVTHALTLREFDDAFTAPLHGYSDVDDYWHRASAKPVLRQVAIPGLLVNACNDPFVPIHSLPHSDALQPHLVVWRPLQGGHVGFPHQSGRSGGPIDLPDLVTMPKAVCRWLGEVAAV
jgi:predicted alpha/beta-fold hydrolase